MFTTPLHKHSGFNIIQFMKCSTGIIHYTSVDELDRNTFCYHKVVHDPLNNEEIAECAIHLLPRVYSIVEELKSRKIFHRDFRIPNICFDKQFNPVLIDFDLWCCYFLITAVTVYLL